MIYLKSFLFFLLLLLLLFFSSFFSSMLGKGGPQQPTRARTSWHPHRYIDLEWLHYGIIYSNYEIGRKRKPAPLRLIIGNQHQPHISEYVCMYHIAHEPTTTESYDITLYCTLFLSALLIPHKNVVPQSHHFYISFFSQPLEVNLYWSPVLEGGYLQMKRNETKRSQLPVNHSLN